MTEFEPWREAFKARSTSWKDDPDNDTARRTVVRLLPKAIDALLDLDALQDSPESRIFDRSAVAHRFPAVGPGR